MSSHNSCKADCLLGMQYDNSYISPFMTQRLLQQLYSTQVNVNDLVINFSRLFIYCFICFQRHRQDSNSRVLKDAAKANAIVKYN